HHRLHKGRVAPRSPPTTNSILPTRPETGRAPRLRQFQTQPPAPDAVEGVAPRAGRAAERTTDGDSRMPAPSLTPPQPLAKRSYPRPPRSGTSTAPSFQSQPPPATPTTDPHPGGHQPPTHPAPSTHCPDRVGSWAARARAGSGPSAINDPRSHDR